MAIDKKKENGITTLSFIGSDKNAGKTTVLNFVYRRLKEIDKGKGYICLGSIGINGEEIDFYENRQKPMISIYKGSYFITAAEYLRDLTGKYRMVHSFSGPHFNKVYVLGECLFDFQMILEGPNNKEEILRMKRDVQAVLPDGYLLIDGSIDRQFIAHPAVSDEFYFAVLVSTRKEQLQKARDLLFSLSLQMCPQEHKDLLKDWVKEEHKSVLFGEGGELLYHGKEIPFADKKLQDMCLDCRKKKCILYLNGALSKSLYALLAPLKNLTVILNNFTLYQNISVYDFQNRIFWPKIFLFHPVKVRGIFLKQETTQYTLTTPKNIPVYNLFREELHEIRV